MVGSFQDSHFGLTCKKNLAVAGLCEVSRAVLGASNASRREVASTDVFYPRQTP